MNNEEKWSFDELVHPSHSALIVVDMQNDYCSRNGGFCKLGMSVDQVQLMAPKLARFIKSCRENNVFIVHTRNQHSEFTDTVSWKRFGGSKLGLARRDSEGQDWFNEYREFTPWKEDYVVTKHRYSAFLNTDLETVLKTRGIRTLLITGTATNICVESTAREGAMRDFNVVLVNDCTATYDPLLQESTELNIERHFGTVAPSEKIVRSWNSVAPKSEILKTNKTSGTR